MRLKIWMGFALLVLAGCESGQAWQPVCREGAAACCVVEAGEEFCVARGDRDASGGRIVPVCFVGPSIDDGDIRSDAYTCEGGAYVCDDGFVTPRCVYVDDMPHVGSWQAP